MRQLRVSPDSPGARVGVPADRVVEVDGVLDVVTAHDLLRLVAALMSAGHHHLRLDLSRVTDADVDGVAGLARCSSLAVETGRVLTWSRCSPALLAAVRRHPRVVPAAG